MGAVLAKFRKEQTTEKKLEQLEQKIQDLEKYTFNTQEQKKRFVGTFLAVSVGIYVIALISIIYFVYFPRTWKERCLYIVPLLIFPFVIILLRRLFTWYFQRKLNKNADKLTDLRAEKKKILEQVMDKETYKVAVNLLARFGGSTSGSSRLSMGGLTQRSLATPLATNNQLRTLSRPTQQLSATTSPMQTNLQNKNSPARAANQIVATSHSLVATPNMRTDQLRRRTPFPIVNQAGKGVFERCLDYIIGDGPQDRFAMICRECSSHNGMALKEEFDYIAYRCAFCNAINPARKTRPVGPRLLLPTSSADASPRLISRSGDSSNSTPTSESSDDDDGENMNRRSIQLRLTESTANQDESPALNNHEETSTASQNVNEPSLVESTTEPMDVSEHDELLDTSPSPADDATKKTN